MALTTLSLKFMNFKKLFQKCVKQDPQLQMAFMVNPSLGNLGLSRPVTPSNSKLEQCRNSLQIENNQNGIMNNKYLRNIRLNKALL